MASTTATVKELNTGIENAITFVRENGETVNFSLQHFADHYELDLAVFDTEENPRELVTLALAEAKMLRDFLNRDEIARQLDQQ